MKSLLMFIVLFVFAMIFIPNLKKEEYAEKTVELEKSTRDVNYQSYIKKIDSLDLEYDTIRQEIIMNKEYLENVIPGAK